MYHVDEIGFEKTVAWAIDSLPDSYVSNLSNVAFVIEDDPSPEQRSKLHLHNGMTLFGLYEGIPRPQRGTSYNLVLPDKITIFRNPIQARANNFNELQTQVRTTVWHEIAHHYGLDHARIDQLQSKKQKTTRLE